MNRSEAIDILRNRSVYHPLYLDALEMAINSLEVHEKTCLTMRDCTPEEREAMNNAIRAMSYDTGVTLQGLIEHETYIPKSALDSIKTEINSIPIVTRRGQSGTIMSAQGMRKKILDILDKHFGN